MPGTRAEGQLIRPLIAVAGLDGSAAPPPGFWDAVLAVQLAHEASLLHDDVIDAARSRRGAPTLSASSGVARALLAGDHLLTTAYRAAARTGHLGFIQRFARAVERTVAGEAAQGKASGKTLEIAQYRRIVLGKSGELLGCALATGATLAGQADAGRLCEIGRRIGLLYQMLDDLLDYCPLTDTGKEALGDYKDGRWTWVLDEHPDIPFGLPTESLLERMYATPNGVCNVERCRRRIAEEARRLLADLAVALPNEQVTEAMFGTWVERADEALRRELDARASASSMPSAASPSRTGAASIRPNAPGRRSARSSDPVAIFRARLPQLADVEAFQAGNSRSFRFASRFFPVEESRRIARVYAYCRVTDDLADRPPPGAAPEELLDVWVALSREAFSGSPTGLPLLDRVMREMAEGGIPFEYAEELAEGMRMDLRGERYERLSDLHHYTYRVASVVGLWLTRLTGCHQPWILERASRMGRAMQLTNILRDVGEDLRRGRLYLPRESLERHAVDEATLHEACEGGALAPGYPALLEELMSVAAQDYQAGLDALPSLPRGFARPVAVAAHVYRGIHDEIRRNGYDNLRQRAYTGGATKYALAISALWQLRTAASREGGILAPLPLQTGRRK
jgi:15-cis-phytoene synthase